MSEGPIFSQVEVEVPQDDEALKDREHVEFIDLVLKVIDLRKAILLSNLENKRQILSNVDEDLKRLVDYAEEAVRAE